MVGLPSSGTVRGRGRAAIPQSLARTGTDGAERLRFLAPPVLVALCSHHRASACTVAIKDGKIVFVGASCPMKGAEEVDAAGQLVTPGWVDCHTHYDAQVGWDPTLSPSCWHGVTSVVFGNCGVTFAPCWHDDHNFLV